MIKTRVCRWLLALFPALTIHGVIAQNLVPNGDFEQYSSCPTSFSQLDTALYWFNPSNNQAGGGSPDYYHSCTTLQTISVPSNWLGVQQPFNGDAYAGAYLFITSPQNAREYLEVELTTPLTAGVDYLFAMRVNLGGICKYTTDDIGVYFSDTAVAGVNTYAPLPFTPQVVNTPGNMFDTLSWTPVQGNYVAAGGETHIIIGNFNDDAGTTITNVDPAATGDFIYVLIDDVHVVPLVPSGIESDDTGNEISVYPNPSFGEVFLTGVGLKGGASIEVTDGAGRVIRRAQVPSAGTDGLFSLGVADLPGGFYMVRIATGGGFFKKRILKY